MDEAKESHADAAVAAAAALSDQPAAAQPAHAQAAAISHARSANGELLPAQAWMEEDGQSVPLGSAREQHGPGEEEEDQRGSVPVASSLSAAIRLPTAAAASTSSPSTHTTQDEDAQQAALSVKRSREGSNQEDGEKARDELRWLRWQQAQRERAAAAAAASATTSTTAPPQLFLELIGENETKHRVEPLHIGLLPQDWFVDAVPDALICCICTEVARDPPNLEACAHAICRECLTQHRRRSSNCPVCRRSFAHSKLASQPFVQSLVWRLRVRCLQHDKGCQWQGQLGTEMRDLKAHDAKCLFKEATCLACNKKCLLRDMPDHHRNCPHRQIVCTSCHKHMRLSHMPQHQPAMVPPAAAAAAAAAAHADADPDADPSSSEMELGDSDSDSNEIETRQDADADVSSPIVVDSASDEEEEEEDQAEWAAAAAPAAVAVSDPAASALINNLLPPVIPPCSASEACPRGCQDPHQPGHVRVYPRAERDHHNGICPQRPHPCWLCFPAHTVPHQSRESHLLTVLRDPLRHEYALRQIKHALQQQGMDQHCAIQ